MSAQALLERLRGPSGASSAHKLDLALSEAARRYGDRFTVVAIQTSPTGRIQYVSEVGP